MSEEVFDWDLEKSERLLRRRGITFEEIVALIESDQYVALIENENQKDYPGQVVFVVRYDDYLWAVPADPRNDGGWTLRTAYPSRKLMRRFGDRIHGAEPED